MSDARSWLYQSMTQQDELLDLLGTAGVAPPSKVDLVIPAKDLVGVPGAWPFVVFLLGNDTSEGLGAGSSAHRQYVEIWAHDRNEDYLRVDSVLAALKILFHEAPPSKTWGVNTAFFLEASRDLDDQEMGTICRYVRLQIILAS